jgi:hypothetical protein
MCSLPGKLRVRNNVPNNASFPGGKLTFANAYVDRRRHGLGAERHARIRCASAINYTPASSFNFREADYRGAPSVSERAGPARRYPNMERTRISHPIRIEPKLLRTILTISDGARVALGFGGQTPCLGDPQFPQLRGLVSRFAVDHGK